MCNNSDIRVIVYWIHTYVQINVLQKKCRLMCCKIVYKSISDLFRPLTGSRSTGTSWKLREVVTISHDILKPGIIKCFAMYLAHIMESTTGERERKNDR